MSIFKTLLNIVAPGAGTAINVVESIAKTVTGAKTAEAAQEMMENNPEMYQKVMEQLTEQRIANDREESKRQAETNITMRAELVSGNKFQKGWRPLNGYLFGLTLFINYGLTSIFNIGLQVWSDPIATKGGELIFRTIKPSSIPEMVFVFWASVVGVAIHSRGKEKLTMMGNGSPSIFQSIIAGLRK